MKKIVKRTIITVIVLVLLLVAAVLLVFWNELRSLHSIKKLDSYGMFQMTYYGDYGFDDFLKVGAKSDEEIEAFVTNRLLKGLPIHLGAVGDGCTAFVTKNEKGEVLFGRNFDFEYAPSMQVRTTPANGYASISTVNLSFLGYSKEKLPKGLDFDSFLTLAAPYLPFDGVNEKGLAIALLAVPDVQLDYARDKVTLNTTTAIRLVLDHAATVEDAVALLKKYNIYFSGDVNCHYLIADATGASVLVEFWDGKLQTVTTKKEYQIASNFVAYKGLNIGEGYTEFDRYDTVEKTIKEHNGKLTEEEAIALLKEVGVTGKKGEDKLQWSVVYNLNTLKGELFAHRNTDNLIKFQLNP